jgi:hypothetical protein
MRSILLLLLGIPIPIVILINIEMAKDTSSDVSSIEVEVRPLRPNSGLAA